MFIKPHYLKYGDVIGLVSPSSGLAGLVSHRVKQAKSMLEKIGFRVFIAPNALKTNEYTSGTPQERASDIQELFINPEVKAIMSFIGGNHSNQIIKYLDFSIVQKNPKIFIGYSDISVLHFAFLTQSNLTTFYGPAALTQFGEYPKILPYTQQYFEKALMKIEPIGDVIPSSEWTDEVLDWFRKDDIIRSRQLKINNGFEWLKNGEAVGPLIGGCISSIVHLKGTPYWPDLKESILFWEISESDCDFKIGENIATIDSLLSDIELSGVFNQISGMIIGRPFGYTLETINILKKIIIERTFEYKFPILFNVDIGHTDPMITVPIGVRARLDSQKNKFTILESGVSE